MSNSFAEEDKELSWTFHSSTSPFSYPVSIASEKRDEERRIWLRAQAVVDASQFVPECELKLLVKFEMLKWLEPGYSPVGCSRCPDC